MAAQELAYSAVAAIGNRPWLSSVLFRFTKWGNPFATERFSWPYPMYDRMRSSGPVAYGRPYRQWFVFGYDEVQAVLVSPNTATAPIAEVLLRTRSYRRLSDQARTNFARWLLANDPPDHTRLRAAVARTFTPKQVAAYEPLVTTVVDELLDELPSGVIDLYLHVTNRLPIHAISAVLGLPISDREWLLTSSRELASMLDPLNTFDPDSMNRRFAELDTYFRKIISTRRQHPGDDLISVLAAHDDGSRLDDDEIVAMIAFLLFAGHETITGMLGNSIVALHHHPKQRSLLRGEPVLIANAVEELLRYDSAAQVTGRQATADIELGDQIIKAGDSIGLMIGAANHDRRRWPDADALRLDRPDPRPLSFGFGPHHCLGAALARMELRLALPPLLERLGDYALDMQNVTWKRSFTLRGPTSLPTHL